LGGRDGKDEEDGGDGDMREVKVLTVKPQAGEIEYGVVEDGQWVVHGVVLAMELAESTTLQAIQTAATGDAVGKGWLE